MRLLIAALVLALPLAALAGGPSRYHGFLHVGTPDDWEPPGGLEVIRDQAAFEAFVARIPERQITHQNPAPPSEDPLLKRPAFDFGKVALVAAWTSHLHHEIKIEAVTPRPGGGDVRVLVTIPDWADLAERPLGIGQYDLVVVPTFPGPVVEDRQVLDRRPPRDEGEPGLMDP